EWAHGEIWFSTENNFQDQELGPVAAGDLLSDIGAIVFRNRDFVSRFDPPQQVADYGLDALFVISDTAGVQTRPRFTAITFTQDGHPHVAWTGSGRIFQVESVPLLGGALSFRPAAAIIPDFSFDFPVTDSINNTMFYRLKQW